MIFFFFLKFIMLTLPSWTQSSSPNLHYKLKNLLLYILVYYSTFCFWLLYGLQNYSFNTVTTFFAFAKNGCIAWEHLVGNQMLASSSFQKFSSSKFILLTTRYFCLHTSHVMDVNGISLSHVQSLRNLLLILYNVFTICCFKIYNISYTCSAGCSFLSFLFKNYFWMSDHTII